MNNNGPVQMIKFAPLQLKHGYTDSDGNDDFGILGWALRGPYPRCTVYTKNARINGSVQQFDYNSMVTATFNAITVYDYIDIIEEAIKAKPGKSFKRGCYNTKFENNMPTNDVILQATAIAGKSESGVVYLSIVNDKARKLKFPLLPDTRYGKMYDENENLIEDKAILSVAHATNYVKVLKNLMAKAISKTGLQVQELKPKQHHNSTFTSPTTPTHQPADTSTLTAEDLL